VSSHSRSDWDPRAGLALDAPVPAAGSFVAAIVAVHLVSGAAWYLAHGGFLRSFLYARGVRQRIEAGGQYRPLVDAGETWRLWTCVLVHVDAIHLLTNALSLWVLGRILEPVVGSWRWAAWAWAGGVCGAILAHAAGHLQSDGASGAGFALLGAAVVIGIRHRGALPTVDARLLGPVLGVFLALNLILSVVLPFIDLVGHLGGLAAGVALAIVEGTRRTWLLDALDATWVLACAAICGWGWYAAA
jgi:rhomboid protease GluP